MSNSSVTPWTAAHHAPLSMGFSRQEYWNRLPFPSQVQFSSVAQLCPTLCWTAECQASLSITNSQSLLKLMSVELVMPSNRLILCHPLLLPPSIFASIRVFSNESVLRIRWPKHTSSPSNLLPSVNWGSRCFTVTKSLERMKSRIETQPHSAQTTGLCLPCVSH